jgi:hypothetical protein
MTKATKSVANNSLIPLAIEACSEKHKDYIMAIGKGIEAINDPIPRNRIALFARQCHDARSAVGSKDYTGIKPEPVLGFIQEVSNKMVQYVSQLHSASKDADAWDDVAAGGTGTDKFADLCDTLNIEVLSIDKIRAMVLADFEELNDLHSKMRVAMSYIDPEPLFLFASDQEVDGVWEPRFRIDSPDLDSALSASEELWAEIQARKNSAVWDDMLVAA